MRRAGRFAALAWAQVIWLLLVAGMWTGGMFALPTDADYTSGELLDHLLSWMHGAPLYKSLSSGPPYRVLNYPPLFLALVRGAASAGLRPLVAARAIDTIALVGALVVVYLWLRDRGVRRELAWGTAALAGGSFPLLYLTGQFHLEGVAVCATVAGFSLVRRRSATAEITAGVLLALACLTKQSQVVLSLVALSWVLFARGGSRAGAWRVVAAYVATGAAGCAAITALFGAEAWRQMLTYTVGTFSLAELGKQLAFHALPWALLFAIALAFATRTTERRRDAATWYLVGSSIWLLSSARNGASFQYFLDWQLAVMLSVGPALETWIAQPASAIAPNRRRVIGALFGAQVVIADIVVAGVLAYDLHTAERTAQSLATVCPAIPAAPALTVSESPGLVRACGGQPALHPFIMTTLAGRDLWNETPMVTALRARRFGAVVLPFDPVSSGPAGVHAERWTPAMLAAIRTSYRGTVLAGWWVASPSRSMPIGMR